MELFLRQNAGMRAAADQAGAQIVNLKTEIEQGTVAIVVVHRLITTDPEETATLPATAHATVGLQLNGNGIGGKRRVENAIATVPRPLRGTVLKDEDIIVAEVDLLIEVEGKTSLHNHVL